MAVAEAGTAAERGRRRCFCPRRFCMTMTRWRARRACPRTAARSFTISKFHLGRRETERAERSTTSHDQPSFWTGWAGPGCCRFRPRYFFFLGSMQPFASVAMLPHSILSLKRCLVLGLSTESLPSVASRESSCVVAAVESQFFYHWKIHLSDG